MSTNWRIIKDFPNYEVSDSGLVKHSRKDQIVNGTSLDGYVDVYIYDISGNRRHKLVHRLVAEAFLPNPTNLPCVDHIDRVRDNNASSNLRWVSRQGNQFNRNAKGYSYVISKGRYMAQIKINGKSKNLGMYDTEEEARAAYLAAKQTMHIIGKPQPKIVVNVTLRQS